MRRIIPIIIFLIVLSQSINLQAQRSFSSRLFTGGNFGMQFGNATLVDISPLIGYRVTEDIDAGISLTYKYFNYRDRFYFKPSNQYFDQKANIFGGSIFGRYYITEIIFAHVEIEYLDYTGDTYNLYNNGVVKGSENKGITSIFVGGGYKQEIGSNSFFTFMLLYNLNETNDSPYTNPVIRVGFGLGL
jgi:hypothetical protein